MRKYYVFKLKEEVINLYKNNNTNLYLILKRIYFMKKEELGYGFNLFNQIILKFDKKQLDNEIFIKFHKNYLYSKHKNIHIINNLFKDEISTLIIKTTHIYIESTKNNTLFFKILKDHNTNYFICDFENEDYFFLNNLLVYNRVF